ncbi:MAG TPA: lipopolysaccharide biosynthesis protein [Chthoniobacterales bacterium]
MMLPQEQPSMRARVARSMFWIAWSRGALQLLTFATTLFVARILVPADYGVMALATSFTAHAGMLAEMGLGSAIIQFRDLSRRELDTCFWITMTLAMVCFATLFLGASAIARWLAVPTLADVLPVLSLVLPLTACRVVSDSQLRKRLALDRVSQAEVIGAVVTLPTTIGCALAGLGVWTLVIGYVVGPAVRSAATFAFAPWLPGFRIGGERVKDVVRFSLSTLGIRFMWSLREAANSVVLGKVTGQAAVVGLYTMADDVAHLPGTKITPILNMLASPVMAELQTDIDGLRETFYRAFRLTVAIVVPTSAGMALVADDMVAVLLGPKWLPAAPLIRLISLYAAVRAVDVLLPPVLFARRRERFLFWYCLVLLFVMPGAAVLGAVWNGAAGMILFYTPAYCAVMIFMAREALAELKGKFSELWSQTWAIVAATAAMTVVVLILGELAARMQVDSPLARLALLSFAGAVTYGATLFAIGSRVISEGAVVLGWILRPRRAESC